MITPIVTNIYLNKQILVIMTLCPFAKVDRVWIIPYDVRRVQRCLNKHDNARFAATLRLSANRTPSSENSPVMR